jgi:hypothetical protein
MYDDFTYKICEFEKEQILDEIKTKLEAWSEKPGTYTLMGDRGARFSPDSWSFPTVYFATDGKTLEVVTKDCDLADVEDYLCSLARVLGCKILTEYIEYS